MPEIVKERKMIIDSLDENSKKCLKNLCEVLELQQQKQVETTPFEFKPSFTQNRTDDVMDFGIGIGMNHSMAFMNTNQPGYFSADNQGTNAF